MKGMSTNAGMSWQGAMMLVLAIIQAMDADEGWSPKNLMTALALVVIALINFKTTGSGLTPEDIDGVLDPADDLDHILKRGRRR